MKYIAMLIVAAIVFAAIMGVASNFVSNIMHTTQATNNTLNAILDKSLR